MFRSHTRTTIHLIQKPIQQLFRFNNIIQIIISRYTDSNIRVLLTFSYLKLLFRITIQIYNMITYYICSTLTCMTVLLAM